MEKPKQDVIQNLGGSTPLQTEEAGSGREWTPGPWKVQTYLSPPEHRAVIAGERYICRLQHAYQFPTETDANAKLIAASPRLYVLLDDIVQNAHIVATGKGLAEVIAVDQCLIDEAIALLAEARGEAPRTFPKPVRSGVEPQDVK